MSSLPSKSDLHTHSASWIRIAGLTAIVFAIFLSGGFAIGWYSTTTSGNYFVNLILEANETLYYARVGYPGEPKIYYAFGDDFSELRLVAAEDEQIIDVESSRLSNLVAVNVLPPYPQAYQKLTELSGIESVFSIPYFCH